MTEKPPTYVGPSFSSSNTVLRESQRKKRKEYNDVYYKRNRTKILTKRREKSSEMKRKRAAMEEYTFKATSLPAKRTRQSYSIVNLDALSKLNQFLETLNADIKPFEPTPVSDEQSEACYSNCRAKLQPSEFISEKGSCVLCEIEVPCISKPSATLVSYPTAKLQALNYRLSGTYDNSSPFNVVCSICEEYLDKGKVPKFSLENGFYRGQLPRTLPELTWMEKLVISKIRFPLCIVKLVHSKLPTHFGFKGHLIMKNQQPETLLSALSKLPLPPEELPSNIQIVFVNSLDNAEQRVKLVRSLFTVRKDVIRDWLLFLKQHHPGYESVVIDEVSLGQYPDSGTPGTLEDSITCISDPELLDEKSESGDCNGDRCLDSSPTTLDSFKKSFVVDENGSTVPICDLYSYYKDRIENISSKENLVAMIPGSSTVYTSDVSFFANAFPHIFPFGIGTPVCKRKTQVSFQEYVQHCLCYSASSPFRNDFYFHFIAYDKIQKVQLFESIYCKVKNMDESFLKNIYDYTPQRVQEFVDNRLRSSSGTGFPSNVNSKISLIAGKAPFSQISKKRNKQELFSLMVANGAPHIFLTITPNDITNPLAYIFSLKHPSLFNPDAKEMSDEFFRSCQTSANPVSIAEFFNVIIKTIIEHLISPDSGGIFGKVRSYYGMVEVQNRGTLHIHMLLWLDGFVNQDVLYDLLKNDKDLQRKIISYLESIISTSFSEISDEAKNESNAPKSFLKTFRYLPPPDSNSEDAKKILTCAMYTYQRHVHTISCYKSGSTKCRYRKPDKQVDNSHWDEETGCFNLKKSDGWINDFNRYLTLSVNSNTDVRFLTSGYVGLATVYYICNYVTKNSVGIDNFFALQKAAISKTISHPLSNGPVTFNKYQMKARDFFIRFFMSLQKCSQVASTEICTKLLKLPMCYKSDVFAPLFLYDAQAAINAFFQTTTANSTPNASVENLIDSVSMNLSGSVDLGTVNDYLHRCHELEAISLYDYVSTLEKTACEDLIDFPLLQSHPLFESTGYKLRDSPVIPTLYGAFPKKPDESCSDATVIANYERTVLLLFCPFRSFSELTHEFYNSFIASCSSRTKRLIRNLNLLHKSRDEAIRHRKEMKQLDLHASDSASSLDMNSLANPDDDSILHLFENDLDNGDNQYPYLKYLEVNDILQCADHLDSDAKEVLQTIQSLEAPSNSPSFLQSNSTQLDDCSTDLPDSSYLNMSQDSMQVWKTYFESVHLPTVETNSLQDIDGHTISGGDEQGSTLPYVNLKDSCSSIIEEKSKAFTLNEKQQKAFAKIASHVTGKIDSQLMMYLGGEGGTGKSRIIECLASLYVDLKKTGLHMMAFTGTAAYKIKGRTIHSSIRKRRIDSRKRKPELEANLQRKDSNYAFWRGIDCIVIDEITFAPKSILEDLHQVICLAKGIPESQWPSKPFGGIHVILAGDFYQHLSIGEGIIHSFLWKRLTNAIILTEQMRASKDQSYVSILQSVRKRSPSLKHLRMLLSRLPSNVAADCLQDWHDAPFLSSRKKMCFLVNNLRVSKHSVATKNPLCLISAIDTVDGFRIHSSYLRQAVIDQTTVPSGSSGGSLYRTVNISKGCKVTLTNNIPRLDIYGLTNGVTGTVYDIIPVNSDEVYSINQVNDDAEAVPRQIYCSPPIVLFKPDKPDPVVENVIYPGIGVPGVVPIFPMEETIRVKIVTPSGPSSMRVNRLQIPFTGGYAMTCYKSQGSTFEKAIVDLCDVVAGASAYVMLSRLTSLSGLLIARPFPVKNLKIPFTDEIKHVLEGLSKIENI